MRLHCLLTSFLTPLLAAAPASALQASNRIDGLSPGAVLRLGAPSSSSGAVEELHALHFSSALELDAVALIGTEVFLVHHPARFRRLASFGSGFRALGALPGAPGPDALLAVDGTGLSVILTSDGTPFFSKTTPASLADWNDVERLWVFPEAGRHEVFGSDPAASLLRHATYDPALGEPHVAAAWAEHVATTCGTLNDLTRLEFSSNSGPEMALVTATQFAVMNSDATSLLLAGPSTPTDQLENYRIGSSEFLLDLTSVYGGSLLLAGSTLAAPPAPRMYTDRLFSGMLVTRLEYEQGDEACVVLPETSAGLATILGLNSLVDPLAFSPWKSNGRDTISTYEPSATVRNGIRCAVGGDFDRDGDCDLMVTHEGSPDPCVWLNQTIRAERKRVDCVEPSLSVTHLAGGQDQLTYVLKKRDLIEGINEFHVQVWLDANSTTTLLSDETKSWTEVDFSHSVSYSPTGLPAEHVLWMSITGIERDANGVIVSRLPTRSLYYSPSTTKEASLAAAYPVVEYDDLAGLPNEGDPSGYRRGPPPPPPPGNP